MAALGVLEVGVAAVDDRVAGREQRGELLDRRLGGVAGGHHQPHDAGRLVEHGHGLRGGEAALQALAHDLLGLVARAVVGDDPDAGVVQPAGHVAAHAAEADDDQLAAAVSPERFSPRNIWIRASNFWL